MPYASLMATNPASVLADILEDWASVAKGSTVYQSRGMNNGATAAEEWVKHSEAAQLLGEVRQALLAMEATGRRVDHYQRAFGYWARGVFAPDLTWGAGQSSRQQLISELQIDQLRALADRLDDSTLAVRMDHDLEGRVTSGLDAVEDLLRDPTMDLTEPVRNYLFHLTTSVRTVLSEHRALGGVDLIRRINELFGVLNQIADDLDKQGQSGDLASRIRRAARNVVPFVSWIGGATAGTLDVAANVQQLTGGLSG